MRREQRRRPGGLEEIDGPDGGLHVDLGWRQRGAERRPPRQEGPDRLAREQAARAFVQERNVVAGVPGGVQDAQSLRA